MPFGRKPAYTVLFAPWRIGWGKTPGARQVAASQQTKAIIAGTNPASACHSAFPADTAPRALQSPDGCKLSFPAGGDVSINSTREFAESSALAGGNADYVEALYNAWLTDPSAVSAQWGGYFDSFQGRQHGDIAPDAAIARIEAAQQQRGQHAAAPVSDEHARKQAGVLRLLTAYRSRGHLAANLDPLNLAEKMPAPDLGLAFHGLSDADLDTEFDTGNYAGNGQRMKLRD